VTISLLCRESQTQKMNFTATQEASVTSTLQTMASNVSIAKLPRGTPFNPLKEPGFLYPVTMLHCLIFFTAVVGNGLVITTLIRHRRMRTVTNVFLLNLAVSDLLVAVVCMPFTIIPVMMQNFVFGEAACAFIRYLQGKCQKRASHWTKLLCRQF